MTTSTHPHAEIFDEALDEPISVRHFVRTLQAYRLAIVVSLIATAIAYVLVALIVFLATPSQRVTSQPFRLDFEGASNGKFPNGLRFSTADIISPAILLQVYRRNDMQRYATFADFSRSLFILESNAAYETLALDYQARLADPKLSPLDRERLQREYEQKRDAITKNEYSLSFVRFERVQTIPEPIVRKVIADIINSWSDYAMKDQDVLAYRVAVLSPEILIPSDIERSDPIIGTHKLRARTVRLLDNVSVLQRLPGAELARASSNRMSLEEVRLRMQEIQRYRIEPLMSSIRAGGVRTPATNRFLQDQLDYDQLQLQAARKRADSLRETLSVYEESTPVPPPLRSSSPSPQANERETRGGETVMPQLSDTFIDRLGDLVRKSADAQYRQQIANDYRKATEAVIPLEQAVAYELKLLGDIKNSSESGPRVDPASISVELESSRSELAALVSRMNEIYREISRNVYSTSQLVTFTAPASTRVTRSVDAIRLTLWGIAVMLIALPVIVVACLLHNRVQEEEAQDLARSRA
jgi:hypothetical protein